MNRVPTFLADESTMSAYQARIEQLSEAFPDCDVQPEYRNAGRWMAACVMDRQTGVTIPVPLREGRYSRTWPFTESEIVATRRQLDVAIAAAGL